jgi:two-component sensor histidine kinase
VQPDDEAFRSRSVSLACGPNAPSQARRFVRSLELGDDRPLIELLVSELVTNAVQHAHSDTDVTIRREIGCLHVTVWDDSSTIPRLRRADETGGRGLRFVDQLSTSWGSDLVPDEGKNVWFEVRRAPR